jgi:protocatechuate 3,4-dioxygenase beta subunit
MRRQTLVGLFVMALLVSSGAVYSLPQSQALRVPGTESAQPEAIRGRVIDAHGNPVPKARIHVLQIGANPSGRLIYYWSDKEGDFSIKGRGARLRQMELSTSRFKQAD